MVFFFQHFMSFFHCLLNSAIVSKEKLASILMFVSLYISLFSLILQFSFCVWGFSNLTVMCSF